MPYAAETLAGRATNYDINIAMFSPQSAGQSIEFCRLLCERKNVKTVVLYFGKICMLAILQKCRHRNGMKLINKNSLKASLVKSLGDTTTTCK
jgi:hypothetical protein